MHRLKRKTTDPFLWTCFTQKFIEYRRKFLATADELKLAFVVDKFREYEHNLMAVWQIHTDGGFDVL